MALELARSGVRVNSLCPGYFETAINEKEFATEQGRAYVKRLVPQRTGEYHELTGPLLLLVSGAGSYVNGASLVVDGAHAQSGVISQLPPGLREKINTNRVVRGPI